RFEVVRIGALQAGDERDAETRGEERVFAISLLAASPAWVAKDIDVRGPNGEAAIPVCRAIGVHRGGVFRAKFRADGVGDVVHERFVERGSHADGLRKHGGEAGAGDAVKTFIPPVVGGNVKTRNGGSNMAELIDF